MERVFVDTGAWLALVDADEPLHKQVHAAMNRWRGRLVITNYIFDETLTLVRYECGWKAALTLAKRLRGGRVATTVRVTPEDEGAAFALFEEREDKLYSFTDCTSFVVMRRLEIETAIATDSDFRQEGFRTVP